MPDDAISRQTNGGPLLRWAGSKRKLIPHLCQCVPENAQRYIEPFAGSASLFFHLLPDSAVLGDINRELVQTYRVVRDQPMELSGALLKMPAFVGAPSKTLTEYSTGNTRAILRRVYSKAA